MSTTLNNIFGGGNKPAAPYTPPGFAPGIQGTAATPQQGGQAPAQPETPKQTAPPTPEQASQALSKAMPQVTDVKNTPIQPKRMSYEEMFKMLNPYQPLTKEELEKEKKKQKREQIFAAIGDGISALSNLYFTTKGAPSMYTGANNASERTRARWDKLAAERNANMTAYINGLMRARQADDAYNYNERAWARQIGLDKIKQARDAAADARAEAQEKRDAEMHDLNKQLMDNKITQAEYDAKKAEVEAKYAPLLEQSKIDRNNAAAGASNASAGASGARARYYDRGGGSGSNNEDKQKAYDYWMSLSPEQKQQYREWDNRVTEYRKNFKTGKNEPVKIMKDDDDFIQMVWNQRQGYLNNPDNNTMPGVGGNTMPGVE